MRCPNTGRVIRRGQEEIQAEDKVQRGKVMDLQVKIYQHYEKTSLIKEATCPMKYQPARIVGESIGVSVDLGVRFVISVDKRDAKLKIVRGGTEHKELECQHQPQHNNL
ncbi:hypothetical protein Acr_24g0006260 [Actinidia rufa]|uniref:Uncharacterized protein n=1 Tax=Actinidia rufa TaxID=165716 RepID=A0A7J0GUH8_9ERIC|nr:hypothetical protein Acr_24g0006260 [Actinidia rufa]